MKGKFILLLLATATLAVLIGLHVDGINGPSYWRWPWRVGRGFPPYLLLLATALPLAVAVLRFNSRAALPGIVLMMATTLGLEIANRAMDLESFDLTRIATIIEEPGSIGYFTHAQEYLARGGGVRQFLHDYLDLMPGFTLHARNKPTGSILFYVPFLRMFPSENSAALAAGLTIALLATLSVPACWRLVLELTGDREAAYQAAACMAMCPGLVLFLPEFDQFYPVYSCALLILWVRALKTGKAGYAIAFGLLFAFVCFQTFNFLVLGIFFVGYALIARLASSGAAAIEGGLQTSTNLTDLLLEQNLITAEQIRAAEDEDPHPGPLSPRRQRVAWARAFYVSAVAGAAFVGIYAAIWLWSGYNPMKTLLTGIRLHNLDMPATHRVWPMTVPFDLTDFALGTGWVCALLAIYWAARAARKAQETSSLGFWIVVLCFSQLVAVALTGVLSGETARCWIFLFPLLLIPAGLELSTWPRSARLAALGCLWLMTVMLSQNMVFV